MDTIVDALQRGMDPNTLPLRRFTSDEFILMAEAGIFGKHERVELIDGLPVAMTPVGDPHVEVVNDLNDALPQFLAGRASLSVQNPLRLGGNLGATDPQPDVAVIRCKRERRTRGAPTPDDTFLVIEVADSSLAYDTGPKQLLYASRGIPELWVVDVTAREVIVFRSLADGRYTETFTVGRDGILAPQVLPGVLVPVASFMAN